MDDPQKLLWTIRNAVGYPISMKEVDDVIATLKEQDDGDDRYRWWRVSCSNIVHGWDSEWTPTAVVMVHGKAAVGFVERAALQIALARVHPEWFIEVVEE